MVLPNLASAFLLALLSFISCLISRYNSHACFPELIFQKIWNLYLVSNYTSQQFVYVPPHMLLWNHNPVITLLLQTTFSPVPLKESLYTKDIYRMMLILKSLHYQLQWDMYTGKKFLKQISDKDRWSCHPISCTDKLIATPILLKCTNLGVLDLWLQSWICSAGQIPMPKSQKK